MNAELMLHLWRWFLLCDIRHSFLKISGYAEVWNTCSSPRLTGLHVMLIDIHCRHNWAKIRFPGEFVSQNIPAALRDRISQQQTDARSTDSNISDEKFMVMEIAVTLYLVIAFACGQKWSLHFIRFMMYLIDILKCSGPWWTNDPSVGESSLLQ